MEDTDRTTASGPQVRSGRGTVDAEHLSLSERQRLEVRDFDNPDQELRRLLAELLGTYLLVIVAVGAGVVDTLAHGKVGPAGEVTAPALMVTAIILFMGTISGAHLNPAVTFAFALRRDFPWRRVPGYVLAQIIGSILAALTVEALLGMSGGLGATRPGPGFSTMQALLMEVLLTAGLVNVVLGAASGAQNIGPLAALAAGSYITAAGLWGGPVSGASMNPARSFGPALVGGDLGDYWIYLVGPAGGALLAVGVAILLRGRGGTDKAAKSAAEGRN
ncbi:aquaporin [Amnibacterium sp. CER49]|uniref:MIP/aquaporin family protein n=1 Tax=Amnibacterium sp. CER49 TaxID=3039161 RepID=UPI00244CFF26|nr:aquaporin [Amnibacterium sp. CER49]MDH2445130.1 aquaporin [Amnibacterium sp. CER49]